MKITTNENDTNGILQTFALDTNDIGQMSLVSFSLSLVSFSLAVIFILRLFSTSVFQSSLQVGQLNCIWRSTGLVHVKTIAVFITRLQYWAETLLSITPRERRQ